MIPATYCAKAVYISRCKGLAITLGSRRRSFVLAVYRYTTRLDAFSHIAYEGVFCTEVPHPARSESRCLSRSISSRNLFAGELTADGRLLPVGMTKVSSSAVSINPSLAYDKPTYRGAAPCHQVSFRDPSLQPWEPVVVAYEAWQLVTRHFCFRSGKNRAMVLGLTRCALGVGRVPFLTAHHSSVGRSSVRPADSRVTDFTTCISARDNQQHCKPPCSTSASSAFFLSTPLLRHSAAPLVALLASVLSRDLSRERSSGTLQHPRVASILGVERRYHFPLIACRGLSIFPSILGLSKCAFAIWNSTNRGFTCSGLELWLAVLWVTRPFHAKIKNKRNKRNAAITKHCLSTVLCLCTPVLPIHK